VVLPGRFLYNETPNAASGTNDQYSHAWDAHARAVHYLATVLGLEERLGVRLLARTTRIVAATDAGEQLISRLRPALGDVESILDQIVGLRERPAGRVRLLVTPLAATMVLGPKLVPFNRRFRDIVLEITTTQEGRTELVAAGFDAGIHLGESIQRDMVAVRVSRDQRLAVVGSPEYFASHPKPRSPHDLPNHRCINLPGGSPTPYRWEFEKDSEALVVDVSGPLIVDNADLMIRAAINGLGLTFSFEEYLAPQIASGELVRVLEDWCPPFAGSPQALAKPHRTRTRVSHTVHSPSSFFCCRKDNGC
jgi:DNA-binding transcriptional LysR family regulator